MQYSTPHTTKHRAQRQSYPQPSTSMEERIDPRRISQLSQRKLRCVSCDERRDNNNLRRLVLTQNLLLSARNKSNASLASTLSSSSSSSQSSTESEPGTSGIQRTEEPLGSGDVGDDNYRFGFVFPDSSSWGEENGDTFKGVDESKWLDAVLSDLDVESEDDDNVPTTSNKPFYPPRYQPSSHIYIPLPREPPSPTTVLMSYDLHACSPDSPTSAFPPSMTCTCGYDGLPYFDADDSSDSDDGLEPSTPLSDSIGGLAKETRRDVNLEKNISLFQYDDERCSYIRQPPSNFFSCNYSRAYGPESF